VCVNGEAIRDDRQPTLFDMGPPGASVRMLERRAAFAVIVEHVGVRLLRHVAVRLRCSYSTFLRWRRIDPALDAILDPVRARRRRGRAGAR